MTDEEFQKEKERVQAVIDRWFKPIGLGWWTVHFVWHREGRHGDSDLEGTPAICAADCYAQWQYMEATINVYLPVTARVDNDTLEYLIVHEFAHIFVNEARPPQWTQEAADHEERVVSTLAKALIWARLAGQEDAETAEPAGVA